MKEEAIAYQEALDYLYSFVDYSLTRSFRYAPEKFDLTRMVDFLKLLGSPQEQYPKIHIAGTKGKGSTAALTASALQAAGYQVGLYTSPHLQEYTERIQINGQPIAPGVLVELVEFVKPFVAQVEHLTTFEITTALAFLCFARQNVDVAVVEVGLGGRLDATNVIDPLVSVITSLSMDHMFVLGDTLEKIAFEKAGIIKPGRPVVLAPQRDEARQVVEQAARERSSALFEVGRDYLFAAGQHSLDGQTFQVWRAGKNAETLFTPLLGLHQVENAVTAYAALEIAREQGLDIPLEAIQRGFAQVNWPGRFELLRRDPPFIVDSAHNRDSALRLRQALDDYLPGRPVILLFGASEDKDVEGIFAELMPRVSRVIATQSIHPRAMEASAIVDLAGHHGRQAEAVLPLEKAVEETLRLAGASEVVLATGSLFIVAAVRETWHKLVQAGSLGENPARNF
ncbi:MAG TPA: folylpolyglutamate synthase/dihydrofolate synthase family protein [Anaerolineaceae bacterium]